MAIHQRSACTAYTFEKKVLEVCWRPVQVQFLVFQIQFKLLQTEKKLHTEPDGKPYQISEKFSC